MGELQKHFIGHRREGDNKKAAFFDRSYNSQVEGVWVTRRAGEER